MGSFLGELAGGMKRLQEISKEISEVELQDAILEQKRLLLGAKEEILSLRHENSELAEKLKAMESRRAFLDGLIDVDGFKFDAQDGQPTGLPYCPKCEVSEGKFYRLSRGNDQYSHCANCGVTHNAAKDGRVNMPNPSGRKPQPRAPGW
jgi:hypothetical protein